MKRRRILQLTRRNPKKEIEFELKYLKSLSVRQRFETMFKKKLLIRQYAVETDIHPFVKGATFEKVWKNKVRAKFGDTFVNFASLKDLITMKRAAGQVQDLEDLKYLLRLRKISKKRT